MYHYFEALTNTSGAALVGYFCRVIDTGTGGVVTLAADANGTPIVTTSGVANMAKTDSDGNLSFYIDPGTYHLDIYSTDSTTFIRRVPNVGMTTGPEGPTGPTGETGATGTAATLAIGTVTTGNAGSSVIVTNSGTSSAAVLDITIPRGDPAVATVPQGVWFDVSDLSTMRQERTGDAATTPVAVGDPVGSWMNKGAKGGWATAPSDAARPILQKVGRFYVLVFDGVDDVLILPAPAFDLSNIYVCIGGKFAGNVTDPGILTLAPESGNDYNTDHGIALYASDNGQIGMLGGGNGSGGPGFSLVLAGTIEKNTHVIEYFKQGNSGDAILKVDNGVPVIYSNETTFGLQTGALIIGARQGNGILEFCNAEYSEIVVSDATPAMDAVAIRTHVELATYGVQPQYPAIPDLATLTATRNTLTSEIYGGGGIPTAVGTLALESPAPLSAGTIFTNLLKCEKMTIPGYAARPRLLTPTGTVRSDIIYLVHAGHDATWMQNGISQYIIQPLLTAGIRVCAFVLPDGPDDLTSGGPGNHNTDHPSLDQWTAPVSIAINTLHSLFPSAVFYMTGISGGGWTTMMCAALDTRIVKSYQCVGSMPDMIYINRDWEQRLPGLTADYLTLYVLAASPSPRRFMQILYENDPGGPFDREHYNTRPPYDVKLTGIIQTLNGTLSTNWFNYNVHAYQPLSAAAILAELP